MDSKLLFLIYKRFYVNLDGNISVCELVLFLCYPYKYTLRYDNHTDISNKSYIDIKLKLNLFVSIYYTNLIVTLSTF